tara:strand:+ start:1617 stop:1967 length:351 start_codon:yes stop_codon:yes gene_type:complete
MKGFSGFGQGTGSPLMKKDYDKDLNNNMIPDDEEEKGTSVAKKKDGRSFGRKIWDKATQIGMGIRNIDISPGYAGNPQFPDISGDFSRGYQAEKEADEKAAELATTKKSKKSKKSA